MSSEILNLLVSHILAFVESELLKAEPEIIENITQDIKSFITKIEAIISSKSQSVGEIAFPFLNEVSKVAINAVEVAGHSVEQSAQGE